MIVDRIEESARYAATHPLFEQAFKILASTDWLKEPAGNRPIIEGKLSVIVSDYAGRGQDAARLETHRRFIDIQYTVTGTEVIGWAHTRDGGPVSEPYSEQKDIAFQSGRPETWVVLPPGRFAIFFPADAHAPLAGTGSGRKVIVKVAV